MDARTGAVTAVVDTVAAYEVSSVSSTPDGSKILATYLGELDDLGRTCRAYWRNTS